MSRDRCSFCGSEVPEDWLGLEVQRPVLNSSVKDDVEYLDEIFCSQEHAALWLQTALKPPEPSEQLARSPRVAGVLVACVAIIIAGLFTLGVVTAGRWLLELL